ncbi:MAG: phytoene/squalene synthase family protein [Rubrivivax sp.]|jgi:phytoene synthase|nr:phytoene/squalene synthase family protein [Rubrivivax sp.]
MKANAAGNDMDLQACHEMMRGGSKSFFAASRVLPSRVRAPAAALYAFCRVADDAIDLCDDKASALLDLRQRLDAVYANAPRPLVADRALACVVHQVGIPRILLDALLEGFAWDAEGRQYETLEDLHDYAARVAGTVGAMMSMVMSTRTPSALARACELGLAMQLTNIARDVGEDARAGRLFLPRQWLREAGVDPDAWLQQPEFSPAIAKVVQRLLHAADTLYRRAERGVAELPRDCRPAIQSARLVYAEIGREVQAAGFDSVNRRAVVSARRKLALMAQACTAVVVAPAGSRRDTGPVPAVRYLVDAAASRDLPQRTFYDRTVRVIDLLERASHRQRRTRMTPPVALPLARQMPPTPWAAAD